MRRRLQALLIALWCVGGCMLQDDGSLGTMQRAVRRAGASPSPQVSASPSPLESPAPYFASPAPFERIPYALPPGPEALLWLYDRASQDILVYPGAGVGISNVFEWNPYQFYYDDRRDIFLLDSPREVRITLVDGGEVGGFAFSPVFDGKNNLYFLGTADPDLADAAIGHAYVKRAPRNGIEDILGIATGSMSATDTVLAPVTGIGEPFPVSPIFGKPAYLAKINAVGALHGGISSINVTGTGDWVVFTTADGGLYLYDTRRVAVQALIVEQELSGGIHASSANIDPIWGRFVVWHDTLRRSIFVFDRWTGQIDTVPYVAIAWNAETVGAPNFYGSDPFDVVLLVTLPGGVFRLMAYNLLTEQLTNLTFLNLIAGSS